MAGTDPRCRRERGALPHSSDVVARQHSSPEQCGDRRYNVAGGGFGLNAQVLKRQLLNGDLRARQVVVVDGLEGKAQTRDREVFG